MSLLSTLRKKAAFRRLQKSMVIIEPVKGGKKIVGSKVKNPAKAVDLVQLKKTA